jgi:DNA-binding IclR family transcriptional regulator
MARKSILTSEPVESPASYQVRALERGLSVLIAFTAGPNELGMRAFEVGRAYLPNSPIEQLVQPYLRELSDATGQTANVGVLDGFEFVHVATYEPDRPLHFHTRVGLRGELHCTGLGKVLAAHLEPSLLETYLGQAHLKSYTPATITSPDVLRNELTQVRAHELAEDLEELVPGLRCRAAPVRNLAGKVVAAVSISGPTSDFTPAAVTIFTAVLLKTAATISARLGYVNQPVPEAEADGNISS